MNVLAIIQARLGSERLPNKVLKQIPPESGISMIEMVIRKVMLATKVDKIAVVTPDKKIAEIVDMLFPNIVCYVKDWPERDVLREFYGAFMRANKHALVDIDYPVIVRVTGDCPLIQPEEIDHCINMFLSANKDGCVDLVYNTDETTGQLNGEGSDVEVMSYLALAKAMSGATTEEREHVTTYIRKHCKTLFVPCRQLGILSVNTQEDYEKVCTLVNKK